MAAFDTGTAILSFAGAKRAASLRAPIIEENMPTRAFGERAVAPEARTARLGLGDGGRGQRIAQGKLLTAESEVTSASSVTIQLPETFSKYPSTTSLAQIYSRGIRSVLDLAVERGEISKGVWREGTALDVFTHADGSISIGISGKGNKFSVLSGYLKQYLVKNKLTKWTVNEMLNPLPEDIHPMGLKRSVIGEQVFENGRSTCAECRVSITARRNSSPVTGKSTVWWSNKESPYTDPLTGEMIPCESCRVNESRIMDQIKVKE